MFVCSLGSGSSGNATIVRSAAGRTVLIDCGVQYPRLCKNLAQIGIRPDAIDAVMISHAHSDHTQAARLLRERWHTPIIGGPGLRRDAPWLADVVTDAFDPATTRTFGDLTITPIAVSHDAGGAYGFLASTDGCALALFTDLGSANSDVRDAVASADLIVIEANYDGVMLDTGSYPWFLKSRIKGKNGHLSNADCAELLAQSFADDRPRDVWLAHLSQNNNTPEIAVRTVTEALDSIGLQQTCVTALPRYTNGPIWQCIRHQQLTLFR